MNRVPIVAVRDNQTQPRARAHAHNSAHTHTNKQMHVQHRRVDSGKTNM